MLEIILYLREYSGAIQAISTIVLVIVTIFYAIQTRLTVKKMEESKKMEFLPIISVKRFLIAQQTMRGENKFYPGIVQVMNEGNGIARDVNVFFPFDKEINLGTISAGDSSEAMAEFEIEQKILELPKEKRYIKIEYYDIFNRLIITKALIEEIEKYPEHKEPGIDSWKLILPE